MITVLSAYGNESFSSIDEANLLLGFSKTLDLFYLCLFMPVSMLGTLLNSLVFIVLYLSPKFQSNSLFSFLRPHVFISILGNLLGVFYGFAKCALSLEIANNFYTQSLISYFYIPLYNMLYYVKFLIDIAIKIDQIAVFRPKLNRYYLLRPGQMVLVLLILAFVINFPYLWMIYQPNLYVFMDNNTQHEIYRLYHFGLTDFAISFNGKFTLNCIYFIKHFVTVIVEILLNIVWWYIFKQHFSNRIKIIKSTDVVDSSGVAAKKQGVAIVRTVSKKQIYAEKNMSIMFWVNSIVSILHNIILAVLTIYFLIQVQSMQAQLSIFFAHFSSVLRHASSFFILYFFNTLFRNEFKRLFLLSSSSSTPDTIDSNTFTLINH
jgi:hypothetical protein